MTGESLGSPPAQRPSGSESLNRTGGKPSIAACLIVKNEVLDLPIWIAHHLNLGFDRLHVYNNQSDDGTGEVLRLLASELPLDVIDWAATSSCNPRATQGAAYEHCAQVVARDCAWLVYADADEYIVPQRGEDVAGFLRRFPGAGAIAINWLTFGSSHLLDGVGKNPLSTFLWRAGDTCSVNAHTKCAIRPEAYRGLVNPHAIVVDGPIVDVDGMPIEWSPVTGIGTVDPARIKQGPIRLHHYVTRSLSHWQQRVRRGNWSSIRSDSEFDHHDWNDYLDWSGVHWAQAAEQTLGRLQCAEHVRAVQERYKSSGVTQKDREKASSHAARLGKRWAAEGKIRRCKEFSPVTCFIDAVQSDSLRGWAAIKGADQSISFSILLDDEVAASVTTDVERPDVLSAGWACRDAGFEVNFRPRFLDGRVYVLTALDPMGRAIFLQYRGRSSACLEVTLKPCAETCGVVDGWDRGQLRGWALRREADGGWAGCVQVEVVWRGGRIASALADRPRADVARAHECDCLCGFEIAIPPVFSIGELRELEVRALPGSRPLARDPSLTIADLPMDASG